MQIVEPSVTLLTHTPEPELLIERAGRVCWKSEGRIAPGTHVRFIKMLKQKGHTSVFEHACATFLIGTDRAIANELVRHRIASYSQESTRYVNYKEGIKVVCPSGIKEASGVVNTAWRDAMENAERDYISLLSFGIKPQDARSVLPLCLYTEIVATLNFRSWQNFLDQRLANTAHPDMRKTAYMVKTELLKIAPAVFGE